MRLLRLLCAVVVGSMVMHVALGSAEAPTAITKVFQVAVDDELCTCGFVGEDVVPVVYHKKSRAFETVADRIAALKRRRARGSLRARNRNVSRIRELRRAARICRPSCEQMAENAAPVTVTPGAPAPQPTATRPAETTPVPSVTPSVPVIASPTPARTATPSPPQIGTATPTPTQTSTPTPTRTPTGTPTPQVTPCFDTLGNTSCFSIPAGSVGNITRGAQIFAARSCGACHTEVSRRNKTYTQINAAFSNEYMSGLERPSTAALADLTAYLNRFNR
jgi:hypothetical protein